MSTAEPTHVPGPEPSFLTVAGNIFVDPAAVGETVARRAVDLRLLLALVVIAVVLVTGAVLTAPILAEDVIEMLRARPEIPESQLPQIEDFMRSPAGRAVLVAQQVFFFAGAVPVIGLFLWLGQLLFGGRATFGQGFAIAGYSCLISLVGGSVLRTALSLAKGSVFQVSTGLGALVGDRSATDPLRAALDVFDLFGQWAAVSAGIALAVPARLGRGVAIAVSLGVYFLLMGSATAYRVLTAP